jgi:prophage antirepressor-like protein
MSALEQFNCGNWTLRTVLVDGAPWFVAADVARILGYRDAANLCRRLDDDDRGTHQVSTPGGAQQATVITESGLYTAVLGSQLADARPFKQWVTREVLPTLRRTGTYSMAPAAPALPTTYASALRELADTVEQLQQVVDHVDRIAPAADAWSQLEAVGGDMDVRTAAQWLSNDQNITVGQQRLMRFLRSSGWVDRKNVPYQQHIDNGRLRCKASRYVDPDGNQQTRYTPRVTVKGVRDLHRLLGGGQLPRPTLAALEAGVS